MRYFEDFPVGATFDLGSTTVTKESILAFAREYDPQPFHVDEEQAKGSWFGGLIASGWHTAAVMMRLVVDGLLNDSASMGSGGIREIVWPRPVRPGDTLSVRYSVVEATPSRSRPGLGVVRSRCDVRNQHDETVMTLEGVSFFGRRPRDSAS